MCGRTHPERGRLQGHRDTRDTKNRGRKFDTAAELLRSRRPKKGTTRKSAEPQDFTDDVIPGITHSQSESDQLPPRNSLPRQAKKKQKEQPILESTRGNADESDNIWDVYTEDSDQDAESSDDPSKKSKSAAPPTTMTVGVHHSGSDTQQQETKTAPPAESTIASPTKKEITTGDETHKTALVRPRATSVRLLLAMPAYKWNNNSCWLDSSLQAIYVLITRDYPAFVKRMESVPEGTGLYVLVQHLKARRLLTQEINPGSSPSLLIGRLQQSRDVLRKELSIRKLIKSPDAFDSPFVSNTFDSSRLISDFCFEGWLGTLLLSRLAQKESYNPLGRQPRHVFEAPIGGETYFLTIETLVSHCPGDKNRPPHLHCRRIPKFHGTVVVDTQVAARFKGNSQKWFLNFLKVDQPATEEPKCWIGSQHQGTKACEGKPMARSLRLSLPICLIVETRAHDSDSAPPLPDEWKWPAELHPLPPILRAPLQAEQNGIVYDLVGRVFGNHTEQHFRTRFITPHSSAKEDQGVYEYDGRERNGYPVRINRGTLSTCLVGRDIDLRDLPKGTYPDFEFRHMSCH